MVLTTLMSWTNASPNLTSTFSVMFCTGRISLLYPLKRSLTSRSSSSEHLPGARKGGFVRTYAKGRLAPSGCRRERGIGGRWVCFGNTCRYKTRDDQRQRRNHPGDHSGPHQVCLSTWPSVVSVTVSCPPLRSVACNCSMSSAMAMAMAMVTATAQPSTVLQPGRFDHYRDRGIDDASRT